MALSAGTRLGPYEIVAALGAGGMGEVYKARDSRLDRTVAIKVLPAHLSGNPDLKQRFEREAKAISSLNHQNICTLFDVGHQDGTDFLVMEYLEGETLADRLRRGPLPIEQVITVGIEIADALDKAHLQGLVHRDLKPGNIMLTRAGAKLMDFGLAKAATLAVAASSDAPITPSTPTMSVATLITPASPLTQKGQLVGTFQYIAPEVLHGHEADARSDLFAFGCLLYEMATGRPAFQGKSQLSVLTAILEKDPEPLRTIEPLVPRALEQIVSACLAKDPTQRLQSAHDISLQLAWAELSEPATAGRSAVASRLGWAVAVIALVTAAIAIFVATRPHPPAPVLQVSLDSPEDVTLRMVGDNGAPPTLSPDGTMLVVGASKKGESGSALWVRHLNTGTWQRLEGTENATFPFWSPDSKNIAFFTTDGRLCRIGLNGGAVAQIAAAAVGKGGSWSTDGFILFAPSYQSGLYRVSAEGGTPVEVAKLDRALHTTDRWPQLLPDGKHFLYFAASHAGENRSDNGVYFASLDGKVDRKVLTSDSNALYSAGYLLFRSGTSLQARRFDVATGQFRGDPFMVSDDLQYDTSTWHTSFSVSDSGLLVLAHGGQGAGAELQWVDRSGKAEPLKNVPPGDYADVHLSPDGRRVAVTRSGPANDIWIIDLERGTPTRLTFDADSHGSPLWSPDGKRIAYGQIDVLGGGNTQRPANVSMSAHIRNADGSGKDAIVSQTDPGVFATLLQWTHDGKYLIFTRASGQTGRALWALPLFGDRKPFPLVSPPGPTVNIGQGQVSNDGHWIAYTSDESGRIELYLTSFPDATGKIAVTSGGALHPQWREDGKELFYVDPRSTTLMSVAINTDSSGIHVGEPKALFSLADSNHAWDMGGNGRRFLVSMLPQTSSRPMTLISNWTALTKLK